MWEDKPAKKTEIDRLIEAVEDLTSAIRDDAGKNKSVTFVDTVGIFRACPEEPVSLMSGQSIYDKMRVQTKWATEPATYDIAAAALLANIDRLEAEEIERNRETAKLQQQLMEKNTALFTAYAKISEQKFQIEDLGSLLRSFGASQ